MRRYPSMVKLVREAHEQGKVVAAICHAGWMLASANIVRGKTATSYRSIKDDMVNAGANWVDREVVRDGMLVTSRSPADLPAFMRATIAALRDLRRANMGELQVALAPLTDSGPDKAFCTPSSSASRAGRQPSSTPAWRCPLPGARRRIHAHAGDAQRRAGRAAGPTRRPLGA